MKKLFVLLMVMMGLVGCNWFVLTENPGDCFVEDYGGVADIADADVTVVVEGNLYMCPQLECAVWDTVDIGATVRVVERVWGIGNNDGETCEKMRFYVVEGYERDVYIPVDYTDARP